jgi:hypothetical protein
MDASTAFQDVSLPIPGPCTNTKTYHEWMRTPLGWAFIRRKRTIKYIREANSRSNPHEREQGLVISKSYETAISFGFLGYGCRWSKHYPYGSILPSLRVYPVVKNLDQDYDLLIARGSIQEIQRAFASGALHPLTVDTGGQTLLHV